MLILAPIKRLCDAYSKQKTIATTLTGGRGVVIQIKGKNMKSHFTFHNIWRVARAAPLERRCGCRK
jgi:hypothetical protein